MVGFFLGLFLVLSLCCFLFILYFKLVDQLFREWINIAREHFVILLHNQPLLPTRLFRFFLQCWRFHPFFRWWLGWSFPLCLYIFREWINIAREQFIILLHNQLPLPTRLLDFSCSAGDFILSSSGGLCCLFHDACSLSSSGGLGGLFCDACTLSSCDTSKNGSIFNSNVSSSSTILNHLEQDSLSSVLCDALLLCTHFSPSCLLTAANSHCSGENDTSPGECHMHIDFKMSSILCT